MGRLVRDLLWGLELIVMGHIEGHFEGLVVGHFEGLVVGLVEGVIVT